jgi:hypothetical protein
MISEDESEWEGKTRRMLSEKDLKGAVQETKTFRLTNT